MSPVQSRFLAAIELRALMIAMHRQLLVREHPEAGETAIDTMLRKWVLNNGDEPRRESR